MPELPDVEHYRRVFARHAAGRRVERIVVTDSGILRNATADEMHLALRGRRFDEPERRGKWLVAWTDGPAALIHFGMTGDLIPATGPEGRHPYDRVVFELDRGELRYRNMRKLGGLWLGRGREEVEAILGGLGPDALALGEREFLELLARRRGRVKAALMDQSLLAGVGNLLGDEALWRARIHPARRIEDLDDRERAALFFELHRLLREAVDRFEDGWNTRWMQVRGEPGAACPRCGTPLERTVVGGRTSYFCPTCQPPGSAVPPVN